VWGYRKGQEEMTTQGSYQPVAPAQIAVSNSELNEFGCPTCGYRSGSMPVQMGGTGVWRCGECGGSCYVLADGLQEASFGGSDDGAGYTIPLRARGKADGDEGATGQNEPKAPVEHVPTPGRAQLQPHPRRGTPAHGRPDKRPPGGGEYFDSRGLGMDTGPSCFVCGEDRSGGYSPNISGYVQCKEAGERVVAMFGGKGARLDFRKREPDYVQVKVVSCKPHTPCLEKLHELTRAAGGIIGDEHIIVACGVVA
jgi:hypothetical protein